MSQGLHLLGIQKTYPNGHRALRGVHLRVPERRLTTLLGPSGCGKSTLLRLVAGLEVPDAGQIFFRGDDLTQRQADQRDMSLVFQSYALFPYLSVQDNVRYGLRVQGLPLAVQAERSAQVIGLLGLDGLEDRLPHELSGGQQQRTALARALALQPAVVLLDEPLSNLDANLRRHIREDIRQLQQRLGLTVLYVTHDHAEAMSVSDQVVVMQEGRVVQVGTPRDIYEQPQTEFVAGFMGDSTVFEAHSDGAGQVSLGPLTIDSGQGLRQGAVQLVVRPQAWRIEPAGTQGLAGKVQRSAYLGRTSETWVQTSLGSLLVISDSPGRHHEPGAPVSLFLSRRGVSVLSPASVSTPQTIPVIQSRRQV
ncbi:MAG: ABC transporter ATP-binding protein [Curvibacter sp.]|nr:MAG: ABC transporter ATP-binding protein [Curvibacter sp.]